MTDDHGHFTLSGTFTGSFRLAASKDGYLTATKTWTPPWTGPGGPAQGSVQFHLELPVPSAAIHGTYTLTTTADSTCTNLPAEARSRTYTAQIDPGPAVGFVATLTGARFFRFEPCQWGQSSPEACTHNHITLGTAAEDVGGYTGFIERLNDTSYLMFDGVIAGSTSPSGITALLDGNLVYCPGLPVLIDQGTLACLTDNAVSCYSRNHHLELVRR
jgi:hypothetical protein